MKALQVKMPDQSYQKLSILAAHAAQSVDEFAARKLEEFLHAVDDFTELERRAQRGDINKFQAAMAKVAAAPAVAGDELPD